MSMQLQDAARAACAEVGILYRNVPADGRFHPTDIENDPHGKGDGRIKLFADGEGGIALNWKGEARPFFADDGRTLSDTERRERDRKRQEAIKQAEAEQTARHAKAKKQVDAIWNAAAPAPSGHPYLVRKGIQPHGVRVADDGKLIVPVKVGAEIQSLQYITDDGVKRFQPDGKIAGGYFAIGTAGEIAERGALCIAEGYATAATIYEATGLPVVVAFNAGNLEPVARYLRGKFSDAQIIIAGDLDKNGIGQRAAIEAAKAARGDVIFPPFTAAELTCVEPPSDWNDYAALHGLDDARLAIDVVNQIEQKTDPVESDSSPSNSVGKDNVPPTPPEPLPALPDVLPFDYSYLPDTLRGFVKDISERMQCPPDFAAVGAFVMIAAIIGRKVGIRPMQRNDWTVICNLWGAVVGNSGVLKSPTLAAALSAIKKLAAAAFDVFNTQMLDHESQIEVAKLLEGLGKNEAKKKLKSDRTADVKSLLKTDEAIDKPILKRYITNNASYEALGELLMENPNGLLVEADEIIGLLKQLDAGGQEVARSFFLTGADGDKPYTFDRILRGKGLHIDAVCISIIGGIQPGVLAEYVRQATGGGAGADGLLQRFGLMVYPDISPDWYEVDRYPDSALREAVNLLAERLDNLNPAEIGAEVDPHGGVPFLRFDDAAQVLFSEWRASLETRLRSGEEHPAIVSHLSKYRKLIPSLALINHLCDSRQGAVSEAALLRAIAFSEYLESHARRIYSYATRPDIDAAKTLLKRLASGKLSDVFTTRDIYRAGWAGLETPQKAQAAIDLLLEYQHLAEEEITTGGRPTIHYYWIKGAS